MGCSGSSSAADFECQYCGARFGQPAAGTDHEKNCHKALTGIKKCKNGDTVWLISNKEIFGKAFSRFPGDPRYGHNASKDQKRGAKVQATEVNMENRTACVLFADGGRYDFPFEALTTQPQKPPNQYTPGSTHQQPIGNAATEVVAMQPTQAVQLSGKLLRIYLGLGWKGAKVDVDASCIAFRDGQLVGAVSWQELHNSSQTMAHSGDVLTGRQDSGKAEDLERIYLWLEKETNADMFVLVANIYDGAKDFSSMESAYIRVCNADTNQELGRLWLAGQGWANSTKGANAVIFGKVYKHANNWQFMSLGQPLTVPGAGTWQDVVPMVQEQSCHVVPMPQPAAMPPAGKKKQQKPSKVWPCAALAVATAGGTAAAIYIFTCTDMTEGLFDDNLFSDGVDFGALIPDENPLDGIELSDLAEWGQEAGDWVTGAVQSAEEAIGPAAEWMAETGGDAIDAMAPVMEDGAEAIGEFAGEAGEAIGEAAQDFGEAAAPVMEDAGNAVGGFFSGLADMAGDALGGGDGGGDE